MTDYRDLLFSRAFKTVPGIEYNRISYELREENRETLLSIYEVVVTDTDSWEDLKERVYPSLIRYLKYKGLRPESGMGLVVSVFSKDSFYLIEGSHFLHLFCEMEGLSPEAFRYRVMEWLLEGDIKPKSSLLLP